MSVFFEHESYESNESLRVAPLSLPSGNIGYLQIDLPLFSLFMNK